MTICRPIILKITNVLDKIVQKTKTRILYPIMYFPRIVPFMI